MCEVDRLVILASCPGARAGVDRHPGATGGRSPSWTSPGEVKSPVSSIWDDEEATKNLSVRAITDLKNGGGRSQDQKQRIQEDAISGLVLDPVGFSVFGREGMRRRRGEPQPRGNCSDMCVCVFLRACWDQSSRSSGS